MRVKATLRHELKYLITREQYHAVLDHLQARMVPDRFGDQDGAYAISSLYYDTPDYKAYWDKLEGHKVRRKVRVRVYGNEPVSETTPAFVEIKQRVDKLMAKRRVRLPYAQAVDFAAFQTRPPGLDDHEWAVLREVAYLHATLQLQPACVVRYDRLAFEGGQHFPDLRVTFDTNLRGRTRQLSLRAGDAGHDTFFMPPERGILEVKVNHTVPYWLTRLLSEQRCTLRRVSKYCGALEINAVVTGRQRLVELGC